ncbi:MAG TPA: hypothetical protein VLA33_06825 [Gemmatimonadota bacterium]|nr:hypothetical protein [Gemmatimonadota bacterium]
MIPVPTTGARRTLVIAFSTAVAAAVATGACGSDEPDFSGPIDGDTYVAVMGELADLERFPPSGSTSAGRSALADSARQAILDRHGVTADELLDFAEAAGARPDLMVELTDRIVALSDSLARRRTGAGRAADSAAAAAREFDLDLDPESERVPETASDTAGEQAPDTMAAPATDARDSAPATGLDRRSLRERARELRERADTVREPSP